MVMGEYSRVYTNIYQAYLGSGTDKDVQIENNCTRALVNTLLHSDIQLTINFLSFCLNKEFVSQSDEVINYLLQPSMSEDIKNCKQGFILAITDNINTKKKMDEIKEGRADAAIIVGDTVMLIETKLPSNTLNMEQIDRHKDTYLNGSVQNILDNSIKNWSSILSFFQSQKKIFTREKHPLTNFLLEQFEEFCQINGLGVKDENYFIRLLPKEAQEKAREVIKYIKDRYYNQLVNLQNVKGGVAFQKKNTDGYFAKIATSANRKCLILYFSKSNQATGLEYQKKFNEMGIGNKRTANDDKKYPNEAYINLGKIKEIEEITQYIDDAFQVRP